jgi:hypothetical protein
MTKNVNILIRSRSSGQILAETIRHAVGDKESLFQSISKLASMPINGDELEGSQSEEVFHPIKKMKKETELSQLQETLVMDDHILMNRNATYVLKDILSGGSKEQKGNEIFVQVLYMAMKDQVGQWLDYCIKNHSKSSGTAFVLLSMVENVSQDLKEELFSVFRMKIDAEKVKAQVKDVESGKSKKSVLEMMLETLF